eukprot:scaffold65528_cov30-Prasinocladus_malaysianus.AAC.1
MPVDDFLPAAFRFAVHPRPDVNGAECVRRLRASGTDDVDGLAKSGFLFAASQQPIWWTRTFISFDYTGRNITCKYADI